MIGTLTAAFGLGQVIGPVMAAALAGGPSDFGPSLTAASAAVLLGGVLMAAVGPTVAHSVKQQERGEGTQTTD